MDPKPSQPQTAELFRPRLDEQINMKHPLVRFDLQPATRTKSALNNAQAVDLTRSFAD